LVDKDEVKERAVVRRIGTRRRKQDAYQESLSKRRKAEHERYHVYGIWIMQCSYCWAERLRRK